MCIYNIYTHIYTAVEKEGQGGGGGAPPPPPATTIISWSKDFFPGKTEKHKIFTCE